jgi:KDO2-lipid IV(A) lauroyltransferase
MAKDAGAKRSASEWWIDRALRAAMWLAMRLPYKTRVRGFGWLMSRVVAPLAGWNKRVRENLAYVCPDLDPQEVDRLCRGVTDNAGRTMIEIYSGSEFIDHISRMPMHGPGLETLERAHADGRPVVIVTGHFGNYDASRAALIRRGYRVGALYRPMNNAFFNEHYVRAISTIGEPVFPRGRRGYGNLLRFVRDGGMAGFLVDQYVASGADLDFFGKLAPTALSAAELALRYDAPLIPTYGIRQPDGLSFEIVVEAPIPHSDAETMTQALNDSLEAVTRKHMEQWFWIHRRWKPHRQKMRAPAQ